MRKLRSISLEIQGAFSDQPKPDSKSNMFHQSTAAIEIRVVESERVYLATRARARERRRERARVYSASDAVLVTRYWSLDNKIIAVRGLKGTYKLHWACLWNCFIKKHQTVCCSAMAIFYVCRQLMTVFPTSIWMNPSSIAVNSKFKPCQFIKLLKVPLRMSFHCTTISFQIGHIRTFFLLSSFILHLSSYMNGSIILCNGNV